MDFFIKIPRVPIIEGRKNYVLDYCAGKRVLHVGCVDAGVLAERFQKAELMHQQMEKRAAELWGFDIDAQGIQFLKEQGFTNLLVGDAATVGDTPELQGQTFDVIVTSEVVEHLSNPGLFLDSVQKLMDSKTDLIITVPNAFRINTLLFLFRGVEYVHPDHNYWFSYHTITTLMKKHGYQIEKVLMYSMQLRPIFFRAPGTALWRFILAVPKRLLLRTLYSISPYWGDGIIVVAKPSSASAGSQVS